MNQTRQVSAVFTKEPTPSTVQLRLRVLASGSNTPLSGTTVKFKQNGTIKGTAVTNSEGYTACVPVPINQATRADITRTGYTPRLNVGIGNSIPSTSGSACVNKGTYILTPN
jgi:hypothetical protein